MSAIYGLFNRDGAPPGAAELRAMAAALAHWGPDGAGCRVADSLALGHLMQHNTPESLLETLPATLPGQPDLLISADARIDNRAELCATLGVAADERAGIADSTLILLAYRKWGEGCAARLLGDFAFAIWDGGKRQLYCARDHIGARPFFYYLSAGLFAFASDIEGLLAHPALPRRLNEPLLAAYLQEMTYFAEKQQTLFADVVKLPPAHWISVSADGVRSARYWSPEEVAPLRLGADSAYEERLRELLREAVSCRLRAAFPVGAHVSGGIDSTAVALLAARLLRERGSGLAAGFSWSPPPDGAWLARDERQTIAMICAAAAAPAVFTPLTMQDALAVHTRDIATDPTETLLQEYVVQQQAAQRGIRVLLSGWGGDEAITFNGRGYLAELLVGGRLLRLHREVRARSGRDLRRYGRTLYYKSVVPVLRQLGAALAWREAGAAPDLPWLNAAFARRNSAAVRGLRGPELRERPGLHRMQRLLLENGHLTARIEAWAVSGAEHGLEYRYPLLDRRVVEFALAIPAEQFCRGGLTRHLFRRATDDLLPEAVRLNRVKEDPAATALFDRIVPQLSATLLERLDAAAERHPAAAYVDVAGLRAAALSINTAPLLMHTVLRALACFNTRVVAVQAA